MTQISVTFSKKFCRKLVRWFENNKRPLPWRKNITWYSIWVSEVMLQQTQVEKVIPYYMRFIKKFPSLKHLVNTDLQTVLKNWEGLGYYARARNLYEAAHIIQNSYGGVLPDSEDRVKKLPGFGPYITNAVLSIAFNHPLAVVDGNVSRVIARLFKINADIRRLEVKKEIQKYMDELIDMQKPGRFNEAVMELGATVCLPQKPLCIHCPLSEFCQAHATQTASQYPIKSAAPPKKIINAIALICVLEKQLLIARRPENGLLGGFWEFPNFILPQNLSADTISDSEIMQEIDPHVQHSFLVDPVRHTYTHFKLNLSGRIYFLTRNTFSSAFYTQYEWVKPEKIRNYPVHRAMSKMIDNVKKYLEVVAK